MQKNKKTELKKVISALIVLTLLTSLIPLGVFASDIKPVELNKLVGFYNGAIDPTTTCLQMTNPQNASLELDAKKTLIGFDLGSTVRVGRIELISSTTQTLLKKEDYSIYVGTENNKKYDGVGSGGALYDRPIASKLPTTSWIFREEIRGGKVVHIFEFPTNDAVGKYIKIYQERENSSASFILENIGRDTHIYGEYVSSVNPSEIKVNRISSANDTIVNDVSPVTAGFNQLGQNKYTGLDSKSSSLIVDLGETKSVKYIEIKDTDGISRATANDYEIYYSNDNINFDKYTKWTFTQEVVNGRLLHRFVFNETADVDENLLARYIKIHSLIADSDATFFINNYDMDVKISIDPFGIPEDTQVATEQKYIINDVAPVTSKFEAGTTGGALTLDASNNSLIINFTQNEDFTVVELWGEDDGVINLSKDNFNLYFGENAEAPFYSLVDPVDWKLSARVTRDAEGTKRNVLTFTMRERLARGYLKITSTNSTEVGTFTINNVATDVKGLLKVYPQRRVGCTVDRSLNSKPPYDSNGIRMKPEEYAKYFIETTGDNLFWLYRDWNPGTNAALDYMDRSFVLDLLGLKTVDQLELKNIWPNMPRFGKDDYYIFYSTDNKNFTKIDSTTMILDDRVVDGKHVHTVHFPAITASTILFYTSWTLSNDSNGENATFGVNISATGINAYQSADLNRLFVESPKAVKTVAGDFNPYVMDTSKSNICFDTQNISIGSQLNDNLPLSRIEIWDADGTSDISQDAANYSIYTSSDNAAYIKLENFNFSQKLIDGRLVNVFEVPDVVCNFVKVKYTGETRNTFKIYNLDQDLKLFSVIAAADEYNNYQRPAQIGFVDGDKAPYSGACTNFGSTDAFRFDANQRSIVADMNSNMPVSLIKLYDEDSQSRIAKSDLTLYVSDDNITYRKVEDFDFRKVGNEYELYNFAENARYIKVHQHYFEPLEAGDILRNDYFATFTIPDLQKIMKVYSLPSGNNMMFAQNDWKYYKDITVSNPISSDLKSNLVYITYEELGTAALVAEGKMKADYSDIRFVAATGELLPYYDNGSGFYVKLKNIAKNSDKNIIMFYGNAQAKSMSDGPGTLQVDFGSKTLDPVNFNDGDTKAAMLNDGRMILANTGYYGKDNSDVQIRFSNDNGQTWSEPEIVGKSGKGNMGGLLVLPNGEVMITYIYSEKRDLNAILDPEKTKYTVYSIVSDKNITKWHKPVEINVGWNYNLTTTNPLLLGNGHILVPIHFFCDAQGSIGLAMARSADNGTTWTKTSQDFIAPGTQGFEFGYSEGSLIQFGNGVVRLYFRQGGGNNIVKLAQSTSTDNGITWSAPENSPFYSTCTQPALAKLKDGKVIILWAGHNSNGAGTYQRMPMTVAYTEDNGETWKGFQELSGRTLFNMAFGYPNVMQPDICVAPDGSAFLMWWMRGIYTNGFNGNSGACYAMRIEDFDKWLFENTGAFDDFERPDAVKGNYWWEVGPRVYTSTNNSTSGKASLRMLDTSDNDITLAARNFKGVKEGSLRFKMCISSLDSGLQFSLRECFAQRPENPGAMFEFEASKDGFLKYRNGAGSFVNLPQQTALEINKWYDISVKFSVTNQNCEVFVNGASKGVIECCTAQNIISYFFMNSTEIEGTGTDAYIDDLSIIDDQNNQLTVKNVSSEEAISVKSVELNKLVGSNYKKDCEGKSPLVYPLFITGSQTAAFSFDEDEAILGFDFGSTIKVGKIELVSSTSATELTKENYNLYVGMENTYKYKGVGSGEDASDLPIYTAVPGNDWTFKEEIRYGKVVHIFEFPYENIVGKYIKIENNHKAAVTPTFVFENLARDTHIYGEYIKQNIDDEDDCYKISAMIGAVESDRNPAKGNASDWGDANAFKFDCNARSIAADLGSLKAVNLIKLIDQDAQSRIRKADMTIYISNDNVSYTKVSDFDLIQKDNEYHLYNFTVTARYIKVHQHYFDPKENFGGSYLNDYFATFANTNLQNMLQVYNVPQASTSAYWGQNFWGQGAFKYYKTISVGNPVNSSLKSNLFYITYEELGIASLVTQGKLKSDNSDVRFADAEGKLLNYYDDGKGFYVRAVNLCNNSSNNVIMYYGNSKAQSMSDGLSTLEVDYGGRMLDLSLIDDGDTKAAILKDGMMMLANTDFYDNYTKRDIQIRYSDDYGGTLSAPVRITNTTKANMGGILVLPDGKIILTYFVQYKIDWDNLLNPNKTSYKLYSITSINNGETWSKPSEIDVGKNYNLSTSNPTLLNNGDILVPVHFMNTTAGAIGLTVARSADNGKTWTKTSGDFLMPGATDFEYGYSEGAIVQFSNQKIKMYFRQGGTNQLNKLAEVESSDNGVTWTQPVDSQFYATCTQPALARLPGGRVLMMWAGNHSAGASTYERTPLTIVYTDDNGETWKGYNEVSGRTLANLAYGYPNMMQPDFCMAPDGSAYVMVWFRGYYTPGFDGKIGSWIGIKVDDFDRLITENTGGFDDFERPDSVKGNYWWEIGSRVYTSNLNHVSGEQSLRIYDCHNDDIAFAARNFTGVTKGTVNFKMNVKSFSSGLELSLRECLAQAPTSEGDMFQFAVGDDGCIKYKSNGEYSDLPVKTHIDLNQWYDISLKFNVSNKECEVFMNGTSKGTVGYSNIQDCIAYFFINSTKYEETGTDIFLDDFMVIDDNNSKLQVNGISAETALLEAPAAYGVKQGQ